MKNSRYLFIFISLLFLVACGSTQSKNTTRDNAIQIIKSFANNQGSVPTVQDYLDAGVVGITEDNLADINQVIFNLSPEEVDTTEEVQALANSLGVEVPIDTVLPTKPTTTTTVSTGKDKTPPVIKLHGNNPLIVEVGTTYTELGATATDNIDGNISANILITGTVSTKTIGLYYIEYKVDDIAGNTVTVYRTVQVKDLTPPVITLNGNASITINKDTTYTEQGATALDNVDGDLSANITISGNVDTTNIGTYNITYSVSDNAGNKATNTRVITVRLPRFQRNNTEQTVIDNDTSLIWSDNSISSSGLTNWSNANSICSNLTLAGKSDWHLPKETTLRTIRILGNNPTIDIVFQHKKASLYWTSTKSKTGYRKTVNFNSGKSPPKSESTSLLTRCVRNK